MTLGHRLHIKNVAFNKFKNCVWIHNGYLSHTDYFRCSRWEFENTVAHKKEKSSIIFPIIVRLQCTKNLKWFIFEYLLCCQFSSLSKTLHCWAQESVRKEFIINCRADTFSA